MDIAIWFFVGFAVATAIAHTRIRRMAAHVAYCDNAMGQLSDHLEKIGRFRVRGRQAGMPKADASNMYLPAALTYADELKQAGYESVAVIPESIAKDML